MEKTTQNILIVFFVSVLSLTAIQFYLQKSSPASVLGTTDVRACYLLHGYCSADTRCPSTYDAYFNPQGFTDCQQKACCVKKSSYSPLSSSPTPVPLETTIPTPTNTPTPVPLETTIPTPTSTLTAPIYYIKHNPYMGAPNTIMYAISIKGNNAPGGSKRLGGNCWYRKLLSTGQWGQWTPFDPFFTERTDWREDYKGCFYPLSQDDRVGDVFEFAGGVTVFYDLNGNGRLDANEPGLTCNGTDSTTRGNTCQNRRVRYTIASLTPVPTSTSIPTPTLAPAYQVKSFSLSIPCESNRDAFRRVDFRCRDGYGGAMGGPQYLCTSVSGWWNQVYQLCYDRTQPTPTR